MEDSTSLSGKNRLLEWLSPGDLEQGAIKLETVRRKMRQASRVWVGSESEDIVQETITRLLAYLDRNPEETAAIPPDERDRFIRGFARNVRSERLRKRQREQGVFVDVPNMETIPDAAKTPPLSEKDLRHTEDCIKKLEFNDADRELLMSESKLTNIADKRGVSAGSLYIKRHRLLEKLRHCLIKKGVLKVEDSGSGVME